MANNDLVIRPIETDSDDLFDALGIIPERKEELSKACMIALQTTNRMSDALQQISTQINHPNELALTVLMLNDYRQAMQDPMTLIKMMLDGEGGLPGM
ncbi:MAG: hypothetical protein ACXADH_03100 [Candidatus Kariarchaeaceae archaeon]|jgi:hypothetical protein